MENNICSKCGCEYITTSIDFKKLCMCNEPICYKHLKNMFDIAFKDENKGNDEKEEL